MARKYGKKNEIKLDPLKYNLCLIGEGGIGKTTLIKQYCEKLAGQDGYIFLDVGKEDGSDAISGIVSEPVWDWEKFDDVTTDIIENRYTDYADLKVVVIDTFDELMNLAEGEVLRLWNRDNPDKKTKFFKATYAGFNGPTDKAIEIVFNRLWELKRVGVSFITIGHTKKSDVADPVTGETYSILTTNMDKRYFNAMKNKVHFLGVCYIDRDIVKQKTGRKNIVTGKEESPAKSASSVSVMIISRWIPRAALPILSTVCPWMLMSLLRPLPMPSRKSTISLANLWKSPPKSRLPKLRPRKLCIRRVSRNSLPKSRMKQTSLAVTNSSPPFRLASPLRMQTSSPRPKRC